MLTAPRMSQRHRHRPRVPQSFGSEMTIALLPSEGAALGESCLTTGGLGKHLGARSTHDDSVSV